MNTYMMIIYKKKERQWQCSRYNNAKGKIYVDGTYHYKGQNTISLVDGKWWPIQPLTATFWGLCPFEIVKVVYTFTNPANMHYNVVI